MVPLHPGDIGALLTLLGDTGNDAVYDVAIVEMTAEQARLSGAPMLPLGAAVRLYRDPQLWLGEVAESGPENVLLITIVHSITDVHELTRLADRFLGKQRTPAPESSGPLLPRYSEI